MTEIQGDIQPKPASRSSLLRWMDKVFPYVATAAATVVYSFLALKRVWEYQANAFDAGLTDNVLYKVASGLGNVSGLTGEAHFAARPLLYIVGLPLYWVNAAMGYHGLLVLQAASVAMVGLSAWLIAESLGLDRTKKYAALLFVLASPAAYWATITEFHMTGLSMGLVAMMVAGAYRRWSLAYFWILPLLASLARVELAVTVAIAGLLLWSVSRAHARVVASVGVISTGVMAIAIAVVMPVGSSFGVHLGYLGIDSLAQAPIAVLRQPLDVVHELLSPVFLLSIMIWLVTIGIAMPMRAARWFLIAVPTLLVAAIGNPVFADLWYQHYWNFVLVGAGIAFVLSLAVWSWSGKMTLGLVASVLVGGWVLHIWMAGLLGIGLMSPPDDDLDPRIAAIAESTPGSLSAPTKLVLPGAHREWVYLFPSPFACRTTQFYSFVSSGSPPDMVITEFGWEESVEIADAESLGRTLSESYEIMEAIDRYTVWKLVPGTSPQLVDACPPDFPDL